MKTMLLFAAATLSLAGCSVEPQQELDPEIARMQQVFPDPVDQYGMDLVYPLESGDIYPTVLVRYFTQDVTEGEVRRSVELFCASQNTPTLTGQAVITRDIGLSTRTLPTGIKKQRRTLYMSCVKAA